MLTVNEKYSGLIDGIGANKLRVAIDAPTRDEVDSLTAKQLAMKTAAQNGFGQGGLCENPIIAAIDAATDKILDETNAFNANTKIKGFRAEFTFANRY